MFCIRTRLLLLTISTVAVVSLVGMLTLRHNQTPGESISLTWGNYVSPQNDTDGHLLALRNSTDYSIGAYITVDKIPDTSAVKLAPGWELLPVSFSHIWNPRICAQMPSVITADGDIYMYDTRRIGTGDFEDYLVWFDAESNLISEAPIDLGRYVGKVLFSNAAGRPWFFVQESNTLTQVVINPDNTLNATPLTTLEATKKVTIAMTSDRQPVVDIFDTITLDKTTYTIENSDLKLRAGADIVPYMIQYTEEKYATHDFGNDIRVTYTLNDPYNTVVSYQDTPIVGFITDAKVYSYILGSF